MASATDKQNGNENEDNPRGLNYLCTLLVFQEEEQENELRKAISRHEKAITKTVSFMYV